MAVLTAKLLHQPAGIPADKVPLMRRVELETGHGVVRFAVQANLFNIAILKLADWLAPDWAINSYKQLELNILVGALAGWMLLTSIGFLPSRRAMVS